MNHDELKKRLVGLARGLAEPCKLTEELDALRDPGVGRVAFLLLAGQALQEAGLFDAAVAALEAGVNAAVAVGDRGAEAACLNRLGTMAKSKGGPRAAIGLFRRALAAAAEAGAERERANGLHGLGRSLADVGEYREAAESQEGALAACAALQDRQGEAAARNGLSDVLRRLGRFDDARRHVESSLALARQSGDGLAEACALRSLAAIEIETGNCAAALAPCDAARELFCARGDVEGEAQCLTHAAVALAYLCRRREAVAEATKGLALYEQLGARRNVATTLTQLGCFKSELGDLRGALDDLDRALGLARETENRMVEARCLETIGIVLAELGEIDRSMERFGEALEIAQKTGDPAAEAYCHLNTATALGRAGDHKGEMTHIESALAIAERIGDRTLVPCIRAAKSECLLISGDPPRALAEAEQALAQAAQDGVKLADVQCLATAGLALMELGDVERADACCQRCLDSEGDPPKPLATMRHLGRFAGAHARNGRFARARDDYQRAVQLLEQLRVDAVPPDSRRSFWKDNIGLFDGLVAAQVRSGDTAGALASSERGKGRTIHDLLVAREVEPGRFRPEPLGFGDIGDLARRLDRTLMMFRVTDSGTFVFRVAPGGGFDTVELPEFTGRRLGELVLRTEDGRPTAGWFGAYSEYKRRRDEAGRLLAEGRADEAGGLLHESHQAWLATMTTTLDALSEELAAKAFEGIEPGTRVTVVPNRALNILPLHACRRDAAGGSRFLIEDYEIGYAPNCNILDLCERRQAQRAGCGERLLAVANPAPPYELVFAEWEVDEIARHFERRTVVARADARQALLENAADCTVLHLSTHGLHDIGAQFRSRLRLGRDEELTLEEVFEYVRLKGNPLVCLSACESGLIDYRDLADEFVGLQAGFLYAGAPTVVASLWTIADYSTALVMMKTYAGVFGGGLTRAAALRRAQLWLKDLTAGEALRLLRAKEEVLEYSERLAREDVSPVRRAMALREPDERPFAHPYFWAGYQLFGV